MRLVVATCCVAGTFAASVAQACSCATPPPPKEAAARASAVFAGKVTSIKRDGRVLNVTIAISRTWKGTKGKSVKVVTVASGAACGFGFQAGQQYLVYAHAPRKPGKYPPVLGVSLCSRTKLLASAAGDLKELGKGSEP